MKAFMVHASPVSAKTALRLQMRALRRQWTTDTPDAPALAAQCLPPKRLKDPGVVSGYRPQGGEFDPWPLLDVFAKAGWTLTLPVALDREAALAFRAYAPGDALEPDAFNVPSPCPDAAALEPDLIIAPLLAFDRFGSRMGQGGGHYDRTIAGLRARRRVFVLGLAYSGQETARIPTEPHDQPLDAILTEKAYIEVSKDL